MALGCAAAFATTMGPAVAELDISDLEAQVLSGQITPEMGITVFCGSESTDMTEDAFCSCPEEALRLLKQRIRLHQTGDTS